MIRPILDTDEGEDPIGSETTAVITAGLLAEVTRVNRQCEGRHRDFAKLAVAPVERRPAEE